MSKLEIKPKRFTILDANDPDCRFQRNIDVLNECLGLNRGLYRRASYPHNAPTGKGWIPGTKENEKFFVWMPKLHKNSSEWVNSISDDDSLIIETAGQQKGVDYFYDDAEAAANMQRLVFVQDKPKTWYRFVGVFAVDKYELKKHVFKRIATKVRLIGNPVSQIEIIEE